MGFGQNLGWENGIYTPLSGPSLFKTANLSHISEFPLVLEVWGPSDLHFQETEGPFSFLRVPTLLKFLCVCLFVCARVLV